MYVLHNKFVQIGVFCKILIVHSSMGDTVSIVPTGMLAGMLISLFHKNVYLRLKITVWDS